MINKPLYQLNASGFGGQIIDMEISTDQVWTVTYSSTKKKLITFDPSSLYSKALESIKTNPIRINAIQIITSIAQLSSFYLTLVKTSIVGEGSRHIYKPSVNSKMHNGTAFLIFDLGIKISADDNIEFEMNAKEQITLNCHYVQLASQILK